LHFPSTTASANASQPVCPQAPQLAPGKTSLTSPTLSSTFTSISLTPQKGQVLQKTYSSNNSSWYQHIKNHILNNPSNNLENTFIYPEVLGNQRMPGEQKLLKSALSEVP